MGWLGDLLDKIGGSSPVEFVFAPKIAAPGLPEFGQPIVPDECYVELYVESLRLAKARKLATRFNGVVYSFVKLSRESEPDAHLAAISKPEKLTELDKGSLDRVITLSKKMMGAVPWRGGTLGLELGLFSVKSENLLGPILDYVTKVSSTAGVSFVGAAKPFVPLIVEGMDLIAGQRTDTAIEVAVDTDLPLGVSSVSAILAVEKGSIDLTKLSLDPNDRKLLLAGKPLDCGYCVFSIRRTLQKVDYGEIPELQEKYAALQAAIKENNRERALGALSAFRLATITSLDLIPSDADRLVEKAASKIKAAFPAGGIARPKSEARVEKLGEIGLYE